MAWFKRAASAGILWRLLNRGNRARRSRRRVAYRRSYGRRGLLRRLLG